MIYTVSELFSKYLSSIGVIRWLGGSNKIWKIVFKVEDYVNFVYHLKIMGQLMAFLTSLTRAASVEITGEGMAMLILQSCF